MYTEYILYNVYMYILWQQLGHIFWLSLCVCPINFACFVLFPNPVSNNFPLRSKVCHEIIPTCAQSGKDWNCSQIHFLLPSKICYEIIPSAAIRNSFMIVFYTFSCQSIESFPCKLLCRVSSRRAQIKSFLYLLLIKKRKGSPKKVPAWQLSAWE